MTRRKWLCGAVLISHALVDLSAKQLFAEEGIITTPPPAISVFSHGLLDSPVSSASEIDLTNLADDPIGGSRPTASNLRVNEPPAGVLAVLAIFTLLGGRHLMPKRKLQIESNKD